MSDLLNNTQTRDSVRSEFGDDPDFTELLEMFADSIVEKRQALTVAAQANETDQLRTLAH
jgi:HPt (histidine-containing phosphotransfer) domain-containing protein